MFDLISSMSKSAIFVHDKGSELLTQYLFTFESTPVLSDPCTAGSYLSSARLSTFPWSTQSRLWTQFRRVSLTEPQEIGPTTGSQSVICCHWDTIEMPKTKRLQYDAQFKLEAIIKAEENENRYTFMLINLLYHAYVVVHVYFLGNIVSDECGSHLHFD